MTWLDWIVIAMFIYFMAQGLIKGATVAGLGAIAVIVAYVLAAMALPSVGQILQDSALVPPGLTPEWRRTVGFTATFGLLYLLLVLAISIVPGGKRPSTPAQVLGIFVGAVKALLSAMAAVGVLLASPLSGAMTQDVERSPIVRYVGTLQRESIQSLRGMSPIAFPPIGPDHKF